MNETLSFIISLINEFTFSGVILNDYVSFSIKSYTNWALFSNSSSLFDVSEINDYDLNKCYYSISVIN